MGAAWRQLDAPAAGGAHVAEVEGVDDSVVVYDSAHAMNSVWSVFASSELEGGVGAHNAHLSRSGIDLEHSRGRLVLKDYGVMFVNEFDGVASCIISTQAECSQWLRLAAHVQPVEILLATEQQRAPTRTETETMEVVTREGRLQCMHCLESAALGIENCYHRIIRRGRLVSHPQCAAVELHVQWPV